MRGSHTRHRTTFSVAETNGSSIPRKSWEEGPPQCRMIGIKPAATSKTSASEPSEAAQLPDTHKQRAPTRSVQSKALDTVKHRPSQPTIPHTSPNRHNPSSYVPLHTGTKNRYDSSSTNSKRWRMMSSFVARRLRFAAIAISTNHQPNEVAGSTVGWRGEGGGAGDRRDRATTSSSTSDEILSSKDALRGEALLGCRQAPVAAAAAAAAVVAVVAVVVVAVVFASSWGVYLYCLLLRVPKNVKSLSFLFSRQGRPLLPPRWYQEQPRNTRPARPGKGGQAEGQKTAIGRGRTDAAKP